MLPKVRIWQKAMKYYRPKVDDVGDSLQKPTCLKSGQNFIEMLWAELCLLQSFFLAKWLNLFFSNQENNQCQDVFFAVNPY